MGGLNRVVEILHLLEVAGRRVGVTGPVDGAALDHREEPVLILREHVECGTRHVLKGDDVVGCGITGQRGIPVDRRAVLTAAVGVARLSVLEVRAVELQRLSNRGKAEELLGHILSAGDRLNAGAVFDEGALCVLSLQAGVLLFGQPVPLRVARLGIIVELRVAGAHDDVEVAADHLLGDRMVLPAAGDMRTP